MYKKRRPARNRRRKKGKNGGLLLLLLLIILSGLGAGIYLLIGKPGSEKLLRPAVSIGRQKVPPRPSESPGLASYSSTASSPRGIHPRQKQVKSRHGTIAIIIDDMGSSIHEAETLVAIGVPITFAIIPGLAKVRGVAETAHGSGIEVMLHIPMEPKGYPQMPFEKNGLLLAMSDQEIGKRMEGFAGAVPHAVGANNHMGSRFTEDRAKMATVIKSLKGRDLFFIDSKTSPASMGERVAREMGIPTASRHVFLDNVQEVGAIQVQLRQLAAMAEKNGSAIGICHPHKATIQALAATLPAMKQSGITFVSASALVR